MSETPSDTTELENPDAAAIDAVAVSFGRLFNEPITQMPEDLYIPPEAMRVFLETFEGPLDLLLYLILLDLLHQTANLQHHCHLIKGSIVSSPNQNIKFDTAGSEGELVGGGYTSLYCFTLSCFNP